MTHDKKKVKTILVVGLELGVFRSIDKLLNRAHFGVDRVRQGEGALALCGQVAFDLMLVKHPLPDMTTVDFFTKARQPSMASSRSLLLVLAEDNQLKDVRAILRDELSTVLSIHQPAAVLDEVASRLLKIAPRRSARLMVKLRACVDTGDLLLMCQTENISEAGMLVRTDRTLPLGTHALFQFTLPGGIEPIEGECEVARHSVPDIEKLVGIGIRFKTIKGKGAALLKSYLGHGGKDTH